MSKTKWTNEDGSITTTLDHSMMMNNLDFDFDLMEELTELGFEDGVDFEFHCARGDDIAHAVTIKNQAILLHTSITDRIDDYEGNSCY
jgi:hypothetical protein